MNKERPRWWMIVIAASFLAMHVFWAYLSIRVPQIEGLDEVDPVFESGTMRVRVVADGSALANAGLRIGDRVLAVDGFPIREARDWKLALDNLQAGQTRWEVLRGQDRLAVDITPESKKPLSRILSFGSLWFGLFSLGLFIGLWALAVVAYETLTGSTPFTATSAAEWRRAVLAGSFTPLSQHLTTSQVNGQAFFETCFATERSKRPGSVAEFLHRAEEAFA
jgi:membrane-associated protease RseP (regulator of RpoE activity)